MAPYILAGTNCWQSAIVCETGSKKNGGFRGNINVSFGKMYDWVSATAARFSSSFERMIPKLLEWSIFIIEKIKLVERSVYVKRSILLQCRHIGYRIFFSFSRFYWNKDEDDNRCITLTTGWFNTTTAKNYSNCHFSWGKMKIKWEMPPHFLVQHLSKCTFKEPFSKTKALHVPPPV